MRETKQNQDLRTHVRVPLTVEVDLFNENTFFTGFTENISRGGLFIATEAPFELGTRLSIRLSLMGGPAREHEVVVRWIRPAGAPGGLPAGMGVQFETLDGDAYESLQGFIDNSVKDTLFFDLD
jgi:type IV pilus assembly protein PilZ